MKGICKECGYNVVFALGNEPFIQYLDKNNDFYIYCSNYSCKNHYPTGIHQKYPEWYNEYN